MRGLSCGHFLGVLDQAKGAELILLALAVALAQFTALAVEDDSDPFIHVVASREAFGTPEEALATFETCGVELVRVFKTPTTPGGMMGHWLRWLIEHEEQQSPK